MSVAPALHTLWKDSGQASRLPTGGSPVCFGGLGISGVGMADTVQCPGCRAAVPVARPPGVDYRVLRESVRGQDFITIRLGQIIVHRCALCRDGEWR